MNIKFCTELKGNLVKKESLSPVLLQFGGAVMLNAYIVSNEVSKGDCVCFMIEIYRMRIVHSHLMVC